jgi:hypothetical protein
MPRNHSMQSSSNNEDRLPEGHYNGGLIRKYGTSRLPEKQTYNTGVVTPAADGSVWNQWQEQELETTPLVVMPAEGTNRGLQKVEQNQAQGQYFSLSIPIQHPRTDNIDLRSIAYRRVVGRGRAPLVIPGSRARMQQTEELDLQPQRLRLLTRWGVVGFALFCVFMICMLTLTPMGHGSGNSSFSAVSVSRSNWSLLSTGNGGGAGIDGGMIPNDMSSASVAYYQNLARQDAVKWNIPPEYYVRQIQQESHFDPNATSFAGAIGIAQFEPATAAQYGIDPHNPVQSLDAGAHFMSDLDNYFGGDYRKALAGYNAGAGAVDNAVAACGSAWLSCMDGQPQAYVEIIVGY